MQLHFALRRRLHLRYPVLVTVGAFDPVYVVRARGAGEGRIHLLNVETAMGHLRMAGFAGRSRVLIVPIVTGKTAKPFMHSHRGPVVS